jgi:N-acetyl-anhydromuramyl-L-alanine amidase AmpD
MMEIDSVTYSLNTNNYIDKEFEKRQIVLGNTLITDMKHVNGWKKRLGGNYKKTSTFTIDRKGKIYQHFDPKFYSDFIGDKSVDKKIITISLENQGWLLKDSLKDRYVDWVGNIYRRRAKIIEKRWRGFSYWDPYTPSQYKATLKLIEYLCNEFNIPKKIVGHNTQIENINLYEGITYRSNYFKEKTDLSPAWDFKKIKNKLEENTEKNEISG